MSQLINKLKAITKSAPQPIGFHKAQPVLPKPKMLLITSLPQPTSNARLADYAKDSDAILLRFDKSSEKNGGQPEPVHSLPNIPWGKWIEDVDEKDARKMTDAGCDFAVFPPNSTVSALGQGKKIGKILQIESSIGDGLLRTLNELPVDAVLIPAGKDKETRLTWRHLMLFQRSANILTKPLLVTLPPNITANEIRLLWEAGIDGIIITTGDDLQENKPAELRRAIAELDRLPPRKRGKTEALLPHVSEEIKTVEDSEEEEDY
ncbi:hypothetical protein ACFLXZ_01960 [Chloroflexota bacterium]